MEISILRIYMVLKRAKQRKGKCYLNTKYYWTKTVGYSNFIRRWLICTYGNGINNKKIHTKFNLI